MAQTILILGAGPNVGLSCCTYFSQRGFKTAILSRNPSEELRKAAGLAIMADFERPEVMKGVFEKVRKKLAYACPMSADPLSIPLANFTASLNVNIGAPYAAMQEAAVGWRTLPEEVLKTFIFTGNACLHTVVLPLGVGKVGMGHLIEGAVMAYGGEGFRFYYADQRTKEGAPIFTEIGGEAHAEFYYELATKKTQEPWEHTLVKEEGFVDFGGKVGEIPNIEKHQEEKA